MPSAILAHPRAAAVILALLTLAAILAGVLMTLHGTGSHVLAAAPKTHYWE